MTRATPAPLLPFEPPNPFASRGKPLPPRPPLPALPPTPGLVDQYFNDSTAQGDAGQDFRGPWNQGGNWQFVESPAFRELRDNTGAR